MSQADVNLDSMPVVRSVADFNKRDGTLLERLIFNNRFLIIFVFAIFTLGMSWQVSKLSVNASFDAMLPQSHPYIKNYLEHKKDLKGIGNNVRIIVENPSGTIYDAKYLGVLQKLNDDLYAMSSVDRSFMKSIWMPLVRWVIVTEKGFAGGPVMPFDYNGSASSLAQLRLNVDRAGIVGSLVANDLKSSVIVVPLLDVDADTNKQIDYRQVADKLEELRSKYQAQGVKIHIVGFAKLMGDLIDGLKQIMQYFGIAAMIAAVIIWLYTRDVRSTLIVIGGSLIAVVWQLGLLATFKIDLDPYSVLVPFLIFAIGVSHGAQKMNGIMQDVGRGTHKYIAARYTFRRLFLAGMTALLADVVGFAVLMIIDIPVIRSLALNASLGVGILIFTNLILVPILLSYVGVSKDAAARSVKLESKSGDKGRLNGLWDFFAQFTSNGPAKIAIFLALFLGVGAGVVRMGLQIGDIDAGAPELRPNSRYNQDVAYMLKNYALSNDQFVVMVTTPTEGLVNYETVRDVDRLGWELRQVPGVQATKSYADDSRLVTSGYYEGAPKWLTLTRSRDALNSAIVRLNGDNPDLFDSRLSVTPLTAYLTDHQAATLTRVSEVAEKFIAQHKDNGGVKFKLAAGNAGIETATNIVVKTAMTQMLIYVYLAVGILCYITFRSWRAVLVALVPLVLTSLLCEALMVVLGIGVKVATLPVVALGVGIGVDYALYLLSVQLAGQRKGLSLADAYRQALAFTGKVVALVGITLAAGVVTWVVSPLKFQADMGILLTFMFLWNMVGALILIPALSHFFLQDKRKEVSSVVDVGLAKAA